MAFVIFVAVVCLARREECTPVDYCLDYPTLLECRRSGRSVTAMTVLSLSTAATARLPRAEPRTVLKQSGTVGAGN